MPVDIMLQTKLNPPPLSPVAVMRPRVMRLLEQGITRGLTLIAAPAGFGKTTVAAAYIASLQTAASTDGNNPTAADICWLALDPSDNDIVRFFQYLIAGLQRIDPHCGAQTAALISAQPMPPEAMASLLLNELVTLDKPLTMILDDYHLIENVAIHNALITLIEHLPPAIHLLLLSRSDPPMPLARWRVRGHLTEIRAADLRFTTDEVTTFLQESMALDLRPAALTQLTERTEGWIAALQLAALSLQRHTDVEGFLTDFGGAQRHVVDYLVDEVFRLQPVAVQHFLLATAVLDRFCADLCAALLAGDDTCSQDKTTAQVAAAQAQLEDLERRNLFLIPLDGERRWYRYHALFAEFLRHRLGDAAEQYHRRAAHWYRQKGFVQETIDHLLAADDLEAAAAEIGTQALSFVLRHQLGTVARWLDALPPTMRRQRLPLALCDLWLALGSGNLAAMEAQLAQVEQVAQAAAATTVIAAPLRGELAAAQALIASFRQDQLLTIRYAQEALDLLPMSAGQLRTTVLSGLGYGYYCAGDLVRAESTLRHALQVSNPEFVVTHVTIMGMLAMTIELQGRLSEAVTIYRKILAEAQVIARSKAGVTPHYLPNPSVLLALHGLALRLYEFNELAEAEVLLAHATALSIHSGNQLIEGHASATLALIRQAQGDAERADQLTSEAEAILQPLDVASYDLVRAQRITLWCKMGRFAEAVTWAAHFTATHPPRPQPLTAFETSYFALARVWIKQEQFAWAASLLTDLAAQATASKYAYYQLWSSILQIVRLAAEGKHAEAEQELHHTLQWAALSGYIRSFVDEGPVMQGLLHSLRAKTTISDPSLTAYIDRILSAFPAPNRPRQSASSTAPSAVSSSPASVVPTPTGPAPASASSALIEPLTEREIEVLQLVARGLSNQAMAAELTVALSTVKKHLVHIYGKLGVNSRTQAILRATELGLL